MFHHTRQKAADTDKWRRNSGGALGYVKNTKTKRITNRTTRNAINMICPLMPAFFITMATFFCTTQYNGAQPIKRLETRGHAN